MNRKTNSKKVSDDKKQLQSYSLRISPELRNECQALADQKGMSLNEWMKRALSTAVLQNTDAELEETIAELKAYLLMENEKRSWSEYLNQLIQDDISGGHCPNCGAHNPKSNKFCKECGENLIWEDPKKSRADAFYNDFVAHHPMKDTWDFLLTGPDTENREAPYCIWGFLKNSRRAPKICKMLKDADFEKGEKLLNAQKKKSR